MSYAIDKVNAIRQASEAFAKTEAGKKAIEFGQRKVPQARAVNERAALSQSQSKNQSQGQG